jgi:hypothetical protein
MVSFTLKVCNTTKRDINIQYIYVRTIKKRNSMWGQYFTYYELFSKKVNRFLTDEIGMFSY